MGSAYKVVNLIDDIWQVIDRDCSDYNFNVHYQGRLADCEAWIRLNEGGYM